MRWRHLVLLNVLVLLSLPADGQTDEKPIKPANIPTQFTGQFVWLMDPSGPPGAADGITVTINKFEEKDGVILFSGADNYHDSGFTAKIHGKIDPQSHHFTMWESEPSNSNSTTDGSFEGTISLDLQSIDAVWTTRATGKKGKLHLQTAKTRQSNRPPTAGQ
jgi:hypothetical protein